MESKQEREGHNEFLYGQIYSLMLTKFAEYPLLG